MFCVSMYRIVNLPKFSTLLKLASWYSYPKLNSALKRLKISTSYQFWRCKNSILMKSWFPTMSQLWDCHGCKSKICNFAAKVSILLKFVRWALLDLYAYFQVRNHKKYYVTHFFCYQKLANGLVSLVVGNTDQKKRFQSITYY